MFLSLKLGNTDMDKTVCIEGQSLLFTEKIAEGRLGWIFKGIQNNSEPVVIKVIHKDLMSPREWKFHDGHFIPTELFIAKLISLHPHDGVIGVKDAAEDADNFYLIMENFSGCMDLFDFIECNPSISEKEAQKIIAKILDALHHFHSMGIVHGDVKDENVLINSSGSIKLIDFGSSWECKAGKKRRIQSGSADYTVNVN